MAVTSGKDRNGMDDSAKKKTNRPKVRVPKQKTDKSKPSLDTESNIPCRRRVYTATILEEMGIDTSNLPKGSKLIKRKDKVTGEDILTRILCGEEVDASFLPCDYVRHFENGTDAEVTKISQAVA